MSWHLYPGYTRPILAMRAGRSWDWAGERLEKCPSGHQAANVTHYDDNHDRLYFSFRCAACDARWHNHRFLGLPE